MRCVPGRTASLDEGIALIWDPENFVAAYAASSSDLKNRVMLVRKKLKDAHISSEHRMSVAAKGEMLNLWSNDTQEQLELC